MDNLDKYSCVLDIFDGVLSYFDGRLDETRPQGIAAAATVYLIGLDLGGVKVNDDVIVKVVFNSVLPQNNNSDNILFYVTITFPQMFFPVGNDNPLEVNEYLHGEYIRKFGDFLASQYDVKSNGLILVGDDEKITAAGTVYGNLMYPSRDIESCDKITTILINDIYNIQSALQDVIDAYSTRYLGG